MPILFFMFFRNTILLVAGVALVIAAILTIIIVCKNAGKKLIEELKPSAKRDMLLGLRDNAEAFADYYEPLFILASGRPGRKEWVFDSWLNAVDSLEGNEAFKAVFTEEFGMLSSVQPEITPKNKRHEKKLAKKAKKFAKKKTKLSIKKADKLLTYLYKAGISRDDTSIVVADETTAEKYDIIGNTSIEESAQYDVYMPYWTLTIKKRVKLNDEDIQDTALENAEIQIEDNTESEADEEMSEIQVEAQEEQIVEAPAVLSRKEKKAQKKEAKKNEKAEKKAIKADKKAAKKNNKDTEITETVILLSKGAIK